MRIKCEVRAIVPAVICIIAPITHPRLRIFTKQNDADRYEGHQRSEKCAYGTEKFCSINLSKKPPFEGSPFGPSRHVRKGQSRMLLSAEFANSPA